MDSIFKHSSVTIPKSLQPLVAALTLEGATPVLVGGYLRDTLLGIASEDIDIEVFDIENYEKMALILAPFGKVNYVGKSFGILKMQIGKYSVDFSLPRLEEKVSVGHTGFLVHTDPKLPFKEAAARRDFTVNAIGYNLVNMTLLDPYNGLQDLQNGILHFVNEQTFTEDPLRVFRAVRFCARFAFTCSKELIILCRSICDEDKIQELAKERICEEFSQLLLQSTHPSRGLQLFETLHLLRIYPELSNCNNFQSTDTMHTLLPKNEDNLFLMVCSLAFSFSDRHLLQSFLEKVICKKALIQRILHYFQYKNICRQIDKKIMTNYAVYKLSTHVNIEILLLLLRSMRVECSHLQERALFLGVFTCKPKPLIGGKDLIAMGMVPSQKFSCILESCYDAQLQEKFTNRQEAIAWLQKNGFLL